MHVVLKYIDHRHTRSRLKAGARLTVMVLRDKRHAASRRGSKAAT